MINGCIDGFSRQVQYLRVHTNNMAATMFEDFVECLIREGIPSRMRADGGGEFVQMEKFMNYTNGEERGSFIRGKSTHNQRIERYIGCFIKN